MSKIVPQVKSITSDTIIFNIDDRDIEEAYIERKGDTALGHDPIAVALKKIGKYRTVFVGWLSVSAWKGPIRHDYQIVNAKEVQELLQEYDAGVKDLPKIRVELFFEQETQTADRYGQRKVKPREPVVLGPGGDLIS